MTVSSSSFQSPPPSFLPFSPFSLVRLVSSYSLFFVPAFHTLSYLLFRSLLSFTSSVLSSIVHPLFRRSSCLSYISFLSHNFFFLMYHLRFPFHPSPLFFPSFPFPFHPSPLFFPSVPFLFHPLSSFMLSSYGFVLSPFLSNKNSLLSNSLFSFPYRSPPSPFRLSSSPITSYLISILPPLSLNYSSPFRSLVSTFCSTFSTDCPPYIQSSLFFTPSSSSIQYSLFFIPSSFL